MNILKFIKQFFNNFKLKMQFKMCKKEADRLHIETRKRYHVVPISAKKLIVVDNSFIDFYNQKCNKKNKLKKIDIVKLLQMSLYSTR